MSTPFRRLRLYAIVAVAAVAVTSAVTGTRVVAGGDPGRSYRQVNLVSDVSGVAAVTDPNLVNPWGLVHSPTSPWWISDNGTGVSTLYDGAGEPFPVGSPLVVTIPPPAGGSSASPTGVVFNGTSNFTLSAGATSAPALFIFATEDGTISGWAPQVDLHNAILEVDNSANPTAASGAVYKGLALGTANGADFLYATNFRAARIDVFDHAFKPVSAFSFSDAAIPAGFAPFGIANIGNKLYVTYAEQNAAKHDDVSGPGNGFVDVYSSTGALLQRLVSHGVLNSPWGMALAPNGFGKFSRDLLVGNFGDGHINAYDPKNGELQGTLLDEDGKPIVIGGLWGLGFGNGANAGPTHDLFFTAGIGAEGHGLFGDLKLDDRN
jgi:uncharacterized protein (TIGR03118 family)